MGSGELETMVKQEWKKVIVYTDLHNEIRDENALLIMREYMSDHKKEITHIIDCGDGIDNPHMSDFPVNPEFNITAQQGFDDYANHLKYLQDIIPNAKKIIIPGNHDKARLAKAKRMNRGIASLRCLDYENVLKESLKDQKVENTYIAQQKHILKLTKDNSVLFTHGDPRIDPNIKGGVTGLRRTAETYPFNGDIIMGHGHQYIQYPRRYDGKVAMQLGGMFDVKKMKKCYISYNPYTTGFLIINYNKGLNQRIMQYVPIEKSKALIDGVEYSVQSE